MLLVCAAVLAMLGVCGGHALPQSLGRADAGPVARATAAASRPVVVWAATCELTIATHAVRCTPERGYRTPGFRPPASGARPAGVSAAVLAANWGTYANFLPFNLVKDSVTQTWTMTAAVQNRLAEPIGTRDGVALHGGVQVAVTMGPVVTGGTGTVSVANASDTGTFTAPGQPYFRYSEIEQPQEYSSPKTWRLNVSNGVTSIAMGIMIATDFPAEQTVGIVPPDSTPAWVYADSSVHDNLISHVVSVAFHPGTSLADRQLAIALVGGKVIGGTGDHGFEGFYVLWLPDDTTNWHTRAGSGQLNQLPQVLAAWPEAQLSPLYRTPHGRTRRQHRRLSPDPLGARRRWERNCGGVGALQDIAA